MLRVQCMAEKVSNWSRKEQIIGLLGTTCYRFQLHLQFEGKGQGQLLKQIKELESLEDSPSVITSMILAS